MKVLFLDMDGVVNSAVFFKVQSKRGQRRALGVAKATSRGAKTLDEYDERNQAMIKLALLAFVGPLFLGLGHELARGQGPLGTDVRLVHAHGQVDGPALLPAQLLGRAHLGADFRAPLSAD